MIYDEIDFGLVDRCASASARCVPRAHYTTKRTIHACNTRHFSTLFLSFRLSSLLDLWSPDEPRFRFSNMLRALPLRRCVHIAPRK